MDNKCLENFGLSKSWIVSAVANNIQKEFRSAGLPVKILSFIHFHCGLVSFG